MSDVTACFVSASEQNVFFQELLDALQEELRAAGVRTETAIDHFPPLRDDTVYVVVPHEYIPLTMPDAHPTPDQLQRTVVIGTEQPGTPWFDQVVALGQAAGAVLDINRLGIEELGRRGVAARLLQLGYIPAWDHWQGDEHIARPIDATFMGGHTDRRAKLLSRCGAVLERRKAALLLHDSSAPHTASSSHFLSGERKWKHLRMSRTIINSHRSELGYFEWQRVLDAMCNGCVVISEHSLGFDPLVPGDHFISAALENTPLVLGALLDDEPRLMRLRQEAYAFLRGELRLSQSIEALAEAVTDIRTVRVHTGVGSTRPLPRKPRPPKPEFVRAFEQRSENDTIRMALKRLLVNQEQLVRSLRRLEDLAAGSTACEQVTSFGPPAAKPRVSVVLTLYNYAGYIGEALQSVGASDYDDFEIVVVDDGSTDGSVEVAKCVLEQLDWVPSKLVVRPLNAGLPAARNLGVGYARGEYLFTLDADNSIYRHALGRLVDALDADPEASFAYGLIEKFDGEGSSGLLSWGPWDPGRLVYGNYVDAMAMIRASAHREVGGYSVDPRLYGCEDFAMWCAMADRGLRGVHVPEILCRYRTGRVSMLAISNINTSEAWAVLLERCEFLERLANRAMAP